MSNNAPYCIYFVNSSWDKKSAFSRIISPKKNGTTDRGAKGGDFNSEYASNEIRLYCGIRPVSTLARMGLVQQIFFSF